jgi:magnesium transporter
MLTDDDDILEKFEVILGRLDRQIQMAENVMEVIATGITVIQTETSNKLTKLIVWLTVAATAVLVPNTIATIFGIPDLQLSWGWVVPILLISTLISAIITYRWTKQFRVNPFRSKRLQSIGNKFRRK